MNPQIVSVASRILSDAARLSDSELLTQLHALARREREATAALIGHLAVFDERRLYRGEGCSSLFGYCTEVLHFSEHAAYDRIEVARAARAYPVILELLAEGSVNLTALRLLAPELTPANHRELLEAARHKSRRQVEELVAHMRPRPPVPSLVRRLPQILPAAAPAAPLQLGAARPTAIGAPAATTRAPAPCTTAASPSRQTVVEPLAPQQYRVQFTAGAETYEKLQLAQDLLRGQIPNGDVGQIIDRALTVLLELLVKQKFAATPRPREQQTSDGAKEHRGGGQGGECRSRYIPAQVKRQVWLRDGGRCTFVAPNGRRCTQRALLEFHHREPYAAGGEATIGNIELRCRTHNAYEAELFYGSAWTAQVQEMGATCTESISPTASSRYRVKLDPGPCSHSREEGDRLQPGGGRQRLS